jgi:hypothetical protein
VAVGSLAIASLRYCYAVCSMLWGEKDRLGQARYGYGSLLRQVTETELWDDINKFATAILAPCQSHVGLPPT